MMELFGGVVGGFGLFIVGMWLLTENLKQLASRRLRQTARRWTVHPLKAAMWGSIAGAVSQSMTALTFIVVSILRSGLTTTQGAIAMILGGWIGTTTLVMIVTFDLKTISLFVLGITGAIVVSERWHRYRSVAASFLGGSMLFFGLVLLKESATPLAEEPWFRDMVVQTGGSLALTFLAGVVLTAVAQSSSAVSVFGISLAAVGIITVDQTIMLIFGTFIGSSLIVYLLSTNLTGHSRQIAMFTVFANVPVCAVAGVVVLRRDPPRHSVDQGRDLGVRFRTGYATGLPVFPLCRRSRSLHSRPGGADCRDSQKAVAGFPDGRVGTASFHP